MLTRQKNRLDKIAGKVGGGVPPRLFRQSITVYDEGRYPDRSQKKVTVKPFEWRQLAAFPSIMSPGSTKLRGIRKCKSIPFTMEFPEGLSGQRVMERIKEEFEARNPKTSLDESCILWFLDTEDPETLKETWRKMGVKEGSKEWEWRVQTYIEGVKNE